MTSDPLDNLDAFYADCRVAPLPANLTAAPLPTPWWLRLAAPLGGLSIGGLLVLVLTAYPSQPSESAGIEAARALTRTQYLAVAGDQVPIPRVSHAQGDRRLGQCFARETAHNKSTSAPVAVVSVATSPALRAGDSLGLDVRDDRRSTPTFPAWPRRRRLRGPLPARGPKWIA